jgi:hypothetical protein
VLGVADQQYSGAGDAEVAGFEVDIDGAVIDEKVEHQDHLDDGRTPRGHNKAVPVASASSC